MHSKHLSSVSLLTPLMLVSALLLRFSTCKLKQLSSPAHHRFSAEGSSMNGCMLMPSRYIPSLIGKSLNIRKWDKNGKVFRGLA